MVESSVGLLVCRQSRDPLLDSGDLLGVGSCDVGLQAVFLGCVVGF